MTVIAALRPFGSHILVADTLVSVSEPGLGKVTRLPATADPQKAAIRSGASITGLKQKVAIISNVAVAYAGSIPGAERVLSIFKRWVGARLLTKEELDRFTSRIPGMTRRLASYWGHSRPLAEFQTEFVFLLRDPTQQGRLWRKPYLWPQSYDVEDMGQLGSVTIAGSGAETLMDMLKKALPQLPQVPASPNPGGQAFWLGWSLNCQMLASELFKGKNIEDLFGGAYEVIYLTAEGFKKQEELTTVFWRVDCSGGKPVVKLPQMIVKHKYVGDFLYLKSARTRPEAGNPDVLILDPLYRIKPVFRTFGDPPAAPNINAIPFDSPLIAHAFWVEFGGKNQSMITDVQVVDANARWNSVIRLDSCGRTVVDLSANVMKTLQRGISNQRKALNAAHDAWKASQSNEL